MNAILAKIKFRDVSHETLRDFLTATTLFFVSIAISLLIFRENFIGLFRNKIPLAGDGLLTGIYIKSVQKSDYLHLFIQNITSYQYGWPGKLDFTSYPVGNTQEVLAIKIFMDLTGIIDPSQIIHIFSILKAGPISVTTFILARALGINRLYSAMISLIFAFNTYNLVRAEGHFFLALTWALPLGITVIFIAFKQALGGKNPSKKAYLVWIFSLLFSFLTGFYYSFFLIIFSFISVIFLFLRLNQAILEYSFVNRTKATLQQLYFPMLIMFVYLLGLLIQTVPVLIRNLNYLKLTGLADRSVIESVIYSGTTESLFFDLYSFGLRIFNRQDLIAYLQTRISWEGAQVGALTGAILAMTFLGLLSLGLKVLISPQQGNKESKLSIDNSLTFILILLSTSLLLYFVSPINFTVSRFLPQIRAWGRLSVVISLLSLMLLGLFLTKINRTKILNFSLVAILALVPILEISQFRQNRPLSTELNNAANSQNKDLKLALLDLKSKYKKNCALVNLPYYPFPEFDRSDDNNIDYGQFQISILDNDYFNWSYGGIKATENFRVWQPLVSEFPPFARASISDQITYGKYIGACGALIDRSYLTKQEKADLQLLLNKPLLCASELDGPMIDNQSRYVTFNYQASMCKTKNDPFLELLARDSLRNDLVWRVDQSSEIGFKDSFQMFLTSSPINVRFKVARLDNSSGLLLKVKISSSIQAVNSSRTLTLTSLTNGKTQSFNIKFDASGIGWIVLPSILAQGNVEKITISLNDSPTSDIGTWGVQLAMRY